LNRGPVGKAVGEKGSCTLRQGVDRGDVTECVDAVHGAYGVHGETPPACRWVGTDRMRAAVARASGRIDAPLTSAFQIAIPGSNAKDAENRRIPFDPQGRLAPILKRRSTLGPSAYVFGTDSGEFQRSFKTAWEALLLRANGHETKRIKPGAWVDRDRVRLRQIDLHWHDLRHEGACRLLADGVDIRTIQLMLGHADIKQTQRYLNITDEELRKAMTGVWERRRQLRAVNSSESGRGTEHDRRRLEASLSRD
jgi:integrase